MYIFFMLQQNHNNGALENSFKFFLNFNFFWKNKYKTQIRQHRFDKRKGLYELLWVVIHGPLRIMFHNFIYLNPNKKVKNQILC
jgi:hypothetical protein